MKKLLNFLIPPRRPISSRPRTERDLIRREAKVGARLFGIVRPQHRREFFCLDSHTWIWYEEWPKSNGGPQSMTTRYELHGKTVLKHQQGQPSVAIEGQELQNFAQAVRAYYIAVASKIYNRPVQS